MHSLPQCTTLSKVNSGHRDSKWIINVNFNCHLLKLTLNYLLKYDTFLAIALMLNYLKIIHKVSFYFVCLKAIINDLIRKTIAQCANKFRK